MHVRLTNVSIVALLLGLASAGLGNAALADTPQRMPDRKFDTRAPEAKSAEGKNDRPAQANAPTGRQKILDDLFDRLGKTRDEA